MAKANSVAIPEGFNPADPASVAAAFALVPSNGADAFTLTQNDIHIIGPTLTVEQGSAFAGGYARLTTVPYALVLPAEELEAFSGVYVSGIDFEDTGTEDGEIFTGLYADAQVFDPDNMPHYVMVDGTAPPVLGNSQASPVIGEAMGWAAEFDNYSDELSRRFFLDFMVTIDGSGDSQPYINSNAYITFGGQQNEYQDLGADNPPLRKLMLGSGDFSVQRILFWSNYDSSRIYRIRWEGNSAYDAQYGDSNRFVEVAFFPLNPDDVQYIEVRTGNIEGPISGPFMVANATTALATATFAANQSWVFEGTDDGATWTVHTGKHMALPAES